MTIDYIYQLLGMKEVELNATRNERDQLKIKVNDLNKELEKLKTKSKNK